ncbi:polyprenyl diphosphate synthase, partial [Alphaproteobacteria bacterium]|nr:polyprenyl diphosphate synthase [Alphaproteobacteria bacterium]
MKLNHLSIILDGNRRWALSKNLPSYEGHKKGAENLWDLIDNVRNYELKYLTVFVFSTENWKRSNSETSYLVSLLGIYLDDIISKKKEINFKIRFIGDMSIFNKKIQDKLSCIENFTNKNSSLTVTLALNYGGRYDIIQAVNVILKRKEKFLSIREEDFKKFTLNFDIPDPDLL